MPSSLRPFERDAILFLIKHLLAGAVGAIIAGTGILVLDIAHLGTLVRESADGMVAAFLVYFGLFITFGSVAMGIGVMGRSDGHWPPRDPPHDAS